jgi:hypothetical protein
MLCGFSCESAVRPIEDFESMILPAEAKPNLSQLSRLSLAKPAKLTFFKTPASAHKEASD